MTSKTDDELSRIAYEGDGGREAELRRVYDQGRADFKAGSRAATRSKYPTDAMVWTGVCDNGMATVAVYPHPDSAAETVDLIGDGPRGWEGFTSCPVCDERVDWNGSDPVENILR